MNIGNIALTFHEERIVLAIKRLGGNNKIFQISAELGCKVNDKTLLSALDSLVQKALITCKFRRDLRDDRATRQNFWSLTPQTKQALN